MSVKVRLGVMMFLQYAIWGAWGPVLSNYMLNDLGFTGFEVGAIMGLLPLATMISPFVGGQLADRFFATEKVIAFFQVTGGVVLFIASRASSYKAMLWLMLLYCLLYAPTLALTNSIAFINLEDSEKDFGVIRVWGTIGWIAAGFALTGWRVTAGAVPAVAYAGDTLFLAGIFSVIMGAHSLTLPHTPPKKDASSPLAFLEAFRMLRNRNIAVFVVISFIVATELMFYYILTAPFLNSPAIGVPVSMLSAVMALAQVAEILVMALLLPWFLPRYGIRKALALGVIAWPVRYIIFAIGTPPWLVIASLTLHGFCYVFFFTVAFIYIDQVAPRDVRASAQSMIAFVTLGLGNYVGSLFAGWVRDFFTVAGPSGAAVTDWTRVFLVPCGVTVLCAAAFMLFFRDERRNTREPAAE